MLCFESGKTRARQFFAKRSILAGSHFNKVLWLSLHSALKKESVPFRHWLTRHVSHFCGSLRMQHRFGFRDSSKCPCCGSLSEGSNHQLHCSDPERLQLSLDDCNLLIQNLLSLGISLLLAECLLLYLKGRGDILLRDVPILPDEWHTFAEEQDNIGWDNFLIGMVGCTLWHIVHLQLMSVDSLSSVDDCFRTLIWGLLKITHRQWLYRNAVVHSLIHDGLEREEQQTIFWRLSNSSRWVAQDYIRMMFT